MLLAVALTCLLVAIGARGGSGVPGRLQAMAEMAYEFIAGMVRSAAGETGMRFFPFVFAIFFFVLLSNLIGFIPYSFTVTSQIIITAALALMVFLTVIVIGIKEHGLHFFKLFVPPGVPIYILPLVVAIEIISFLSRPVSHSVRLFANMLAGHITLNVFGGFVVMLLGAERGGQSAGRAAVHYDDRSRRPRTSGRVPAGLRVRNVNLHVSQRRATPRSLTSSTRNANSSPAKIGAPHGTA